MIEGSLRDVPLLDVVQVVVAGHKDGVLVVERGAREARLWFEQGRLRAASLTGGVHLGEVLVRLDLLDIDEVQTLLAEQEAAGGREASGEATGARQALGEAAVARGWISEDELARALERHLVEVLGELAGWREGRFRFGEGHRPPGATGGPGFDALPVLMQVHDALSGGERLDPDVVLRRTGDPTAVQLEPEAWELLGLVDGERSALALAAEADLPEGRTLGLLARLVEQGVLARVADAVSPPAVLVLAADATERRLLRLTLLRHGVRPHLVADPRRADDAFAALRPSAVIADARLEPWAWLRGLRRRAEGSHVPVLVLGTPSARWWSRRRWADTDRMPRPYREVDVQEWLQRRLPGAGR